MTIQSKLRDSLRSALISREQRGDPRLRPWKSAARSSTDGWLSCCNICGWHGTQFTSAYHSEGAGCPNCGSIARDRFLYWCWTKRSPFVEHQRVLETSPRLDERYRSVMARRVEYLCSDYDGSAHKGMIKLDLQDADLPDASVDIILTPHVLEHVPDTGRALSEIHRILAPGGTMFLQIPMPQGVTAAPKQVEYHGDNTLVFWRFGWDLRDQLTAAGFDVDCLVTDDLKRRIAAGDISTGYLGPDCDEVDLLAHADASTLTAVATERDARRYGFLPDYHFITWEARKPV